MDCACRTCDKHGEDPNCHSTCEGYLKYQEELRAFHEKKWEGKKKYMDLTDIKKRGMKRMIKGEKRKRI